MKIIFLLAFTLLLSCSKSGQESVNSGKVITKESVGTDLLSAGDLQVTADATNPSSVSTKTASLVYNVKNNSINSGFFTLNTSSFNFTNFSINYSSSTCLGSVLKILGPSDTCSIVINFSTESSSGAYSTSLTLLDGKTQLSLIQFPIDISYVDSSSGSGSTPITGGCKTGYHLVGRKCVLLPQTRACVSQPANSTGGLETSTDNGVTWSSCQNYVCSNNYADDNNGHCTAIACTISNYYTISSILYDTNITGISGTYPTCQVSSCQAGYVPATDAQSCIMNANYCSPKSGISISPIYKSTTANVELGAGSATYFPVTASIENTQDSSELILDNILTIEKATGIAKSKKPFTGNAKLSRRTSDGKTVFVSGSSIIRYNADGTDDSSLSMGLGFNDIITDIAVQSDNKIIAVGRFTGYRGVSAKGIIRLNEDGSRDSTFNMGSGFSVSVSLRLTMLSSGKMMVYGPFYDMYNGVAIQPYMIRINADGTRDSTFSPLVFGDTPSIVKEQSDGKYIVAGPFTTYNGVTANKIIRLTTTGAKDTTFVFGTGFGTVASQQVTAVLIEPDGKILVAGSLTTYNSVAFTGNMIRLTSTGAKDTSFVSKFTKTGASPAVSVIYKDASDGSYLIASPLATATFEYPYKYDGKRVGGIFKISSTGALIDYPVSTGFDGQVTAIKEQSDGKVIYGGFFTSYNGVKAGGLIRLNADSTIDTTFNVGGAGFNELVTVNVIDILPNGKIVIGTMYGSSNTFNGASRPYGLVVLNANGSLDTTINPTLSSSTASVYAIYVNPTNGSFIIGTDILNKTTMRLTQAGVIDSTWINSAESISAVYHIKKDIYGNFYVGGTAASSGGKNIIRIFSTGELDSAFTAQKLSNYNFGMEVMPDNSVLIGRIGSGAITTSGIMHVLQDGSLDYSFPNTYNGLEIRKVVAMPNNKYLLYGYFYPYGYTLRMMNADGTNDSSYNTSNLSMYYSLYKANDVIAGQLGQVEMIPLVTTLGGKVVVGGNFTHLGNNPAQFISYFLNNECLPGYKNTQL